MAAATETAQLVRDAVDGDPRVQVLDREHLYGRRTPMAITALRRLTEQHTGRGARRVRMVGETAFGQSPRDWLEWQRYEAVLNDALASTPVWGLCLFDAQRLPDVVLDAGHRTHPHVVTTAGRWANPRYTDPAQYLRDLPTPREPLEDLPPRLAVEDVADFIGLRHAVAAELAALGGDRDAAEDFLLAVDEMTSNALRHGRPPVDLRLWAEAGQVVCSIRDRGAGPADPFAGYGPAHGTDLARGGMGLWLARQLCDHVDIIDDADGVTVRLATRFS